MRNLKIAAFLAVATTIAVMAFGLNPASAGKKCPSANRDACIAFLQAEIATLRGHRSSSETEVVVRQRKTTKVYARTTTTKRQVVKSTGGQVCLWAKVRSRSSTSALVLYEGEYRGDGAATNVITSWMGDGWQKGSGGYYKRICLNGSLISGKRSVTICGIDGHNTWSSSDIRHLLRVKSIGKGDPANLYGGGGNV